MSQSHELAKPESASRPNASTISRQQSGWQQFGLAVALVVLAIATRSQLQFGDPLWNFTPMVAIALFAGAFFRQGWAFVIPLSAILISDCVIEIAYRLGYTETWGFYIGSLYNYPAWILLVGLGVLLRRPYRWLSAKGKSGALGFLGLAVASGALGSVVFFLVSNFGAWIEFSLRFNSYELSFAGLMNCYAAGLAFYRQNGTLYGDLLYSAVLFGTYLIALQLISSWSLNRQELAWAQAEKNR